MIGRVFSFFRPPRVEPYRYAALARYNDEVAHGLVHTTEWKARMAKEQRLFNAEQIEERRRNE